MVVALNRTLSRSETGDVNHGSLVSVVTAQMLKLTGYRIQEDRESDTLACAHPFQKTLEMLTVYEHSGQDQRRMFLGVGSQMNCIKVLLESTMLAL